MSRLCAGCSARDAVIKRQKIHIRYLQNKIDNAAALCQTVTGQAGDKMNGGNLPRAAYSFYKGCYETAAEIWRRL